MPAPAPLKLTCPNCHAAVAPNATRCMVCKLEVSKMDSFAAAKRAAQQRGVKTTQVETPRSILKPILIAALLLVVVGGIVFYLLRKPEVIAPWLRFPSSREALVRAFLDNIATGTDKGYEQAYALLDPTVKHPEDGDEIGRYRQVYHMMNRYLTGEIGKWGDITTLEADPNDPNIVIAHMGTETIHINTADQTPKEKARDNNHHYAVMNIAEFDVQDAANMQHSAAIMAIVGAEGGPGATRNLQTIIGGGSPAHETPMQRKLRVMPVLHDPRATTRRAILQTWPLRKDPAVRARLEAIIEDQRYQPDVIQTAKDVLNQNVQLEDLIAAGVPDG